MKESVICVEHYTKRYGTTLAVDDISFQIMPGTLVGFVGKNGAGKSTTLRTFLNMIKPTSGRIRILGMDIVKDARKIKASTSYMPSESIFYDRLKVREVLSFCMKFSTSSMKEVEDLATLFELDMEKRIGELSLGNRKKVSIIQALLKKSKLIILDEPTSGLDPLMQNLFFELLLKEKEKGTTIFLSSHNLSEIEKYCDRVLIIKDGKIADDLEMSNVKIAHHQMVSYETADGKKENYEFSGVMNDLVKELSQMNLRTLEIKNKTVEEEFIDYYKE
ncbi:MAG: ABC transporter ATP-binding protein [Lachnospiraceae bacterium]|nr:ABC transporter ATP-binding protein [Lachnospiraceae bacterium]